MSRGLMQEGNSPIVGQSVIPNLRRGAYGGRQNESGRRYGTTAEDLREFPSKDAGEEDYRSFIISDQMYLDYFRTRHERYYFDYRQGESPTVLNLQLKKNTFPTRMSSAYFFFNFKGNLTLKKKPTEEADPIKVSDLTVLNYKFWRILKECSIQVGANNQEVCLHLNCYNALHRIMYFLQLPVSRSNAVNEFAMCDMFADFHVDNFEEEANNSVIATANYYNLLMMGLDPNESNTSETEDKVLPYNFQIALPLTLLHPMFNFDSVLPPEVDLNIKFTLLKPEDMVKKIFFSSLDIPVTCEVDMKNCFLYVEQPEQNPHVLMSLKTKEYKYSPIVLPIPYVANIRKPAGQKTVEMMLIPENGKMPVKIDFMLTTNNFLGSQLFVSQILHYLKSIRFHINQPFPASRSYEYYINASDANVKVPNENSARKDFNFVLPEFQTHHNLQYSIFGEQFVTKGFKYPVKGMLPALNYLSQNQFETLDPAKVKELVKIGNDQYFQQAILQPSNQFNENPYPTVRGSLGLILEFQDSFKNNNITDLNILCNFYYNYELHMENDKVSFLPLEDLGVNLDSAKKGDIRG